MRKMPSAPSMFGLGLLATAVVLALILMTLTSADRPLPVAAGYSQLEGIDTAGGTLTARHPITMPESTIFLPEIMHDYRTCSRESPFGLQIAALHQVVPGENGVQTQAVLSEAEWLALYEEAFPTLVAALKESGACWARVRINWSWIQPDAPPSEYVWGPYHDEKLLLVAETGVQLIATVSDAPDWAASSLCGPVYADQLDEYAQFLTDLVNRYKQPPYNIRTWEIVNEPDYTWADGSTGGLGCMGYEGDQYAQMLATAYTAIKSADPEATVLMGGLGYDWFTEVGGPFYRYFPDEVMNASGGTSLDVLNLHYFPDFHAEWDRWNPNSEDRRYGWLPAPTCGDLFDGQGTAYEVWGHDLIAKVSHFRARMSTCFGLDQPVWVTELGEHGYSTDPDSLAQQARYVIQGYARGLAAGVENITWYALTTPNDSYGQGLLHNDFTPKPSFFAYQTVTSELAGYEYNRRLEVSDVEGYVFRTPFGQEKTVAWGSGTLAFAPASRLRVVDRMGNVYLLDDGGAGDLDAAVNGSVRLQMTVDPVFVSMP